MFDHSLEKSMKRVLSATAILLSFVCASFFGSASAATIDLSAAPQMLAQVDTRGDLRDRMDTRSDGGGVRRDDRNSSDYASRTSKGVGKEGLTECSGDFAYCGASTCKPTGKKIKVDQDGGKTTKEYEEAICTCPIITRAMAVQQGVALHGIAAVNEGNMKGSCKPPTKGTIWSYAELKLPEWPQQSAGYKTLPPIGQECPAGSKTVNCWDYLCTIDAKPTANGVKTATCRCPINEGVFGHPAGGNEVYFTAAGGYFGQNGGDKLKPSDACKMFPVSGPIPQPNQ
jgi:hypothetical protein